MSAQELSLHASSRGAWPRLRRAWARALAGSLYQLDRDQRQSLLRSQFRASRATFLAVLSAGAALLPIMALLEATGLLPGIGYPPWLTATGGGVLLALAIAALHARRSWVRHGAFLGYGSVLAVLMSFPLADTTVHLLARSELFNMFLVAALVLTTRKRTVVGALGFMVVTALLRLELYGPPGGGLAIHWLLLASATAFGLALRRMRFALAAEAFLVGDALRTEARHDALTGLLNRNGWREACGRALPDVGALAGGHSVAFFDIDHFKHVNDGHGHAAGDDVLRTLGTVLGRELPARGVCARLGGEEFVVLLPDTPAIAAAGFAGRVRAGFAAAAAELGVTVSAGIAQARPGETLRHLMHRADSALYQAKADGRDRVAIATGATGATDAVEAAPA